MKRNNPCPHGQGYGNGDQNFGEKDARSTTTRSRIACETMSNKTVWERTSVQNLLRHPKSGRFYGRWTMSGKQIGCKLNADISTLAKLRLNDEAAKIKHLRWHRGNGQSNAPRSAVGQESFAA
jgi:hypothetical protein